MKDVLFKKSDLTERFLFENKIDVQVNEIIDKVLPILSFKNVNGERCYSLKQLHHVVSLSNDLERYDVSKYYEDLFMPKSTDSNSALLSKYEAVIKSCAFKLPVWFQQLNEVGKTMDDFILQDIYALTINFEDGTEMKVYSLSESNLKNFLSEFKADNCIRCKGYIFKTKCTVAIAKEHLAESRSILDDKIYPDKFDVNFNSYPRY